MSYLNDTHPELFFTVPRPGGIVKIDIPETTEAILSKDAKDSSRSSKSTLKSSKSIRSTRSSKSGSSSMAGMKMFTSTPNYVCREARIKSALESAPWVLFEGEEDKQEVPKPPNPVQDSIDILAITITTIMLLSAGFKDISKDHLQWAMSYLENIKDDSRNRPPNVQGILNHIKKFYPDITSFNENDDSPAVYGSPSIDTDQTPAEEESPAPASTEAAPAEEPTTE